MNAILLGYDGTEESKRALKRAIELAKAFQAKLLVTSVAPTAQVAAGRSMGALDPDRSARATSGRARGGGSGDQGRRTIGGAAAGDRPPGGDDRPDRAR